MDNRTDHSSRREETSAEVSQRLREEISRYLTENVLGKCWHEWHNSWTDHSCRKCGQVGGGDFYLDSPQGIFALIKAGREKDWWAEFEQDELCSDFTDAIRVFEWWGIDWDNLINLPTVLYKFLKEREEK